MSSSMQIDVAVMQGPREELSNVEAVARLVSEKGLEMEKTLMALNTDNDNKFRFLWRIDPRHAFYKQKLKEFREAAKNKDEAHQEPEARVADDYKDYVDPPPRNVNPSFRFPSSITLKERGIIKLTALFVARYDLYFLRGLKERLAKEKKEMHAHHFEFLKPTHGRFGFYDGLVTAYSSVIRPRKESLMMNDPSARAILDVFFHHLQLAKLEEGDALAMIDLHAFVSGVDWFAHKDDGDFNNIMAEPWRLSKMMTKLTEMQPPLLGMGSNLTDDEEGPVPLRRSFLHDEYEFLSKGITLKEFGIIKLTAMFVVRYGAAFRVGLMDRVLSNPMFEFLKQNHGCSRSKVFIFFADAYSEVLRLSPKLWRSDYPPCTMALLEFFARCLQLKKLEDGVEMATVDLHALVSGVDWFAHIDDKIYSSIMPRPKRLSTIMKRLGPQLNEDLEAQKQELVRTHAEDLVNFDAIPHFDWVHVKTKGKYRFPAKGFTLEELGIVMLTAQFNARYGDPFMDCLRSRVVMNTQFEFLKVDDRRLHFFVGLVDAYCLVLKPFEKLKNGDAETVLEAFFNLVQLGEGISLVEVVDCFVHVDYEEYSMLMPAPVHLLMDMIPPTLRLPCLRVLPPVTSHASVGHLDPYPFRDSPPPLSPQFLALTYSAGWSPGNRFCIVEVTAQFEARYGIGFRQALTTRVAEKPLLFKFLEQTDGSFVIYRKFVERYSRVLMPSKSKKKPDTVVEAFFRYLERIQREREEREQEEAFFYFTIVQGFTQIEDLIEVHNMPSLVSTVNPRAYDQCPEEPEPKRQKFDESAVVPKDQFLAQHSSGSSAIRVFVPNVGDVVIRKQLGNPNFQQTIKT
uniref:Putative splicing factor 3A subunit 1 n=2 Tax=Noccaea caerulescens TaxID=107243 RepID=A0A1J3JS83_NOCCA